MTVPAEGNSPRIALSEAAHAAPTGATALGPMPPQQIISVSVIVKRRKPLDVNALQGRVLSREEFDRDYAADPADFTKVRHFAEQHGLAVDEGASSLPRRTMVLKGPVEAMNRAFGVTLHQYEEVINRETGRRRQYHAYQGTITMPAEHADAVQAVLGLDARPLARPHFRYLNVAQRATAKSYTPVQVAQLYTFPTGTTGAGQTIGMIELGGGYNTSDLNQYFQGLGLKPPTVVAISVDGGANSPGDPSGADGEVALDIELAGAVAPGAKIAVYFAPNSDQGFTDAISTAVHDTTNKPSVISISWGGPETSWTSSSLTAMNDACQSAAALGVTITVACGDNGSSDGTSSATVDFPASSPYVLACGGTLLEGSGTTISSEVVWNDQASGGGATGGGVSTSFALPSWQRNSNVPAPPGGGSGRGVPDVAGDASPESGYNVLVDGQQEVVGGTSAVAPLWAGLIALINQKRGKPVGFANPTLYQNPGAFRDITQGSNGDYSAGPGWDACTGLGSPNGAEISSALGG